MHPLTVLVVDDHAEVRFVLCRTLERAGHSAYAAADGIDALSMLARISSVDLVICNLYLPRMDGPELAAELAVGYPFIPVLFISGIRVRATDLLAPLLPKPFGPHTLVKTVQGVLDRCQRPA